MRTAGARVLCARAEHLQVLLFFFARKAGNAEFLDLFLQRSKLPFVFAFNQALDRTFEFGGDFVFGKRLLHQFSSRIAQDAFVFAAAQTFEQCGIARRRIAGGRDSGAKLADCS